MDIECPNFTYYLEKSQNHPSLVDPDWQEIKKENMNNKGIC